MGRYSSVQTYADSNANARTVSYEQATGRKVEEGNKDDKSASNKLVQPEKVVNPYGSAAGAGSGEFHVYRHARNRELARLQELTAAERQAALDQEFKLRQQQNEQEASQRTEKRRLKRLKQKQAKAKRINLQKIGIQADSQSAKKVDEEEDEFTYTPMYPNGQVPENETTNDTNKDDDNDNDDTKKHAAPNKDDDAQEPPTKKRATWYYCCVRGRTESNEIIRIVIVEKYIALYVSSSLELQSGDS